MCVQMAIQAYGSQKKEMLRLSRRVTLQMAFLCSAFPFSSWNSIYICTDHMVEDMLPEEEVRLTSQQVDVRLCLLPEDSFCTQTVKSLSQALPEAMEEEERGWFDWYAKRTVFQRYDAMIWQARFPSA